MTTWMRRIRAAFGMGLAWAAAWFGAGMVLLFVVGLGAADVPFPLFFGFLGFLAGATFSVLLGTLGRHRKFDQMSMPRFAGWGALGGLVLAGALRLAMGPDAEFLVLGTVFTAAGAVSAAGTLALARRATEHELLDAKVGAVDQIATRDASAKSIGSRQEARETPHSGDSLDDSTPRSRSTNTAPPMR